MVDAHDFKVGDLVKIKDGLFKGEVFYVKDIDSLRVNLQLDGADSYWVDCSRVELFKVNGLQGTQVLVNKINKPRSISELIKPEGANEQIEKKRLTMWHSFREAVNQAGGNPDIFNLNTTLGEIIDALGQNDIAFVYRGENGGK